MDQAGNRAVALAPGRVEGHFWLGANLGLTADQVVQETRRCMSCGYCMDCEKCWMYCQDQAIEKPMQRGVVYGWKLQNCTGCSKCKEICPCGYIEMA